MLTYRRLVRTYLSEFLIGFRKRSNLSQEKMVESLRITHRTYGDLERGKYCFSASTLLFFLLLLNASEVMTFLNGFRNIVMRFENGDLTTE